MGSLAEQLGLAGEVSEEQFRRMPAEEHPLTGERLKWRLNTKVSGWDLTFSAPKSVSVLWAIAPPDIRSQIRQAEGVAVQVGLGVVEEYACVARLGKAARISASTAGTNGLRWLLMTRRIGRPGSRPNPRWTHRSSRDRFRCRKSGTQIGIG
jgi:conjugative relaxase-like TrwC/TraI family protein